MRDGDKPQESSGRCLDNANIYILQTESQLVSTSRALVSSSQGKPPGAAARQLFYPITAGINSCLTPAPERFPEEMCVVSKVSPEVRKHPAVLRQQSLGLGSDTAL